jgi:hypothetical protein
MNVSIETMKYRIVKQLLLRGRYLWEWERVNGGDNRR